MSNQIRLKRASGSDPGASDLVLGEPAVRTDTGEIFLKKDDGSIAKVAGGIDDGDKGDITVSNSGGTFTIDSEAVTNAKIGDLSINNAKVASNAAIAGSKISPDFGSQNIVTTGSGTFNNGLTVKDASGSDPTLLLNHSNLDVLGEFIRVGRTDNNIRYHSIKATSSQTVADNLISFHLHSGGNTSPFTNQDEVLKLQGNKQVTIAGNLDVGTGLDVTGNISVTGTVDGRDLATDGSKLDGIAASATNVTNTNQLTNGAGFLTSVSQGNITNGAVGQNQLASGAVITTKISDNNVTFAKLENIPQNRIFGRVASGSGDATTLTAANVRSMINVEDGATADQTASEILTLIKTVDGSGSGLDADTLDGVSSGSFLRSDAADTASENITINGLKVGEWSGSSQYKGIFHSSQSSSEYMIISNDSHTFISATGGNNVYIRNGANDSTNQLIVGSGNDALTWRGNKVFHAGNDGSGSGLDADTLDGISSASFLRSSAGGPSSSYEASSDITFSGGAGAATIAANSDIRFTNGNWTGNSGSVGKIQMHSNYLYIVGGTGGIRFREDGTDRWHIDGSGHFVPAADSIHDIGESGRRVRVGYFDELDSAEVRVNNGILETKAAIATSHTLATDFNAMSVSPTVNSGVTVTVPSGAVWAIV